MTRSDLSVHAISKNENSLEPKSSEMRCQCSMRKPTANARTHHAPLFQNRPYKKFWSLMSSLHTAVCMLVGRLKPVTFNCANGEQVYENRTSDLYRLHNIRLPR